MSLSIERMYDSDNWNNLGESVSKIAFAYPVCRYDGLDQLVSESKSLQACEASSLGKKYILVDNSGSKSGMFCSLISLIGILDRYQTNSDKYSGLEVNYKNGMYYSPEHGSNWWEYYFEPLKDGCLGKARITSLSKSDRMVSAHYTEFNYRDSNMGMPRHVGHKYFEKFFKLKAEIQNEIDDFAEKHFTEHYVVGIHYRGTDKVGATSNFEAPVVKYEEILQAVNKAIQENQINKDFKIFIATDEQAFVKFMEEQFPGKVVTTDIQRSTDGRPLHFAASDPYQSGRGALLDCMLLARTNFLIRTSSNLSLFAKYVNPNLTVHEISSRNEENSKSYEKIVEQVRSETVLYRESD